MKNFLEFVAEDYDEYGIPTMDYGMDDDEEDDYDMEDEEDDSEDEDEMTINQLKTIIRSAQSMLSMMEAMEGTADLPDWIESKITLAEDYVVTAANYTQSMCQ